MFRLDVVEFGRYQPNTVTRFPELEVDLVEPFSQKLLPVSYVSKTIDWK